MITVDVKQSAVLPPLARATAGRRAAGACLVAGRGDRGCGALRDRTGPGLTMALSWRALAQLARLRGGRPSRRWTGGAFAHVPLRLGRVAVLADDLAERAHDIGMRVVVWTVNDISTMHRLLDAGVDGIITDRPDRLREVLISRGQWTVPVPREERRGA